MFDFWYLRYRMGKVTPAQLQSLVPDRLTQGEVDKILSGAAFNEAAESEA